MRGGSWLEFLNRNRLAQEVAAQQAAPPIPQYVSRPDLRIRGVADNAALQTRQYAAPVRSRADVLAEQIMANVPPTPAPTFVPSLTPSSPAMNEQAMISRINQEIARTTPPVFPDRPTVVSSNDARQLDATAPDGAYREYLSNWMAIEPTVRTTIPPVNPEGVPFAPWSSLTPEQQAQITQELPTGAFTDPEVQAWYGAPAPAEDDPLGTVVDPVVETVVAPVVREAEHLYNIPEEWWYKQQIQASIEYARTGELPTWAKIAYGDIPGQRHIPEWAPGNAQATDIWFLPNWLDAHPEDREKINKIVAEAEANGQDPTEAVAAWWSAKQGLLVSMGSRGVNDPVNVLGGLGMAGRSMKVRQLMREANTGIPAGPVGRAIAGGLTAADDVVNAPWKIAQPAASTARRIVGSANRGPIRTLADYFAAPSTQQRYRNAAADIAQAETDAARTIIRDAQQERGEGFQTIDTQPGTIPTDVAENMAPTNPDLRLSPIEDQPGTITEPPPVSPDIGFAPAAEATPSRPYATATDKQIVAERDRISDAIDVTDADADPAMLRKYDELSAEIEGRRSGERAQEEPPATQTAISGTPDEVRAIEAETPNTQNPFPNVVPTRGPVPKHFALVPKPELAGTAQARIIDEIAGTMPETWAKIESNPDLAAWTDNFEGEWNDLRSASKDNGDIAGAEPLPENYSEKAARVAEGKAPAPIAREIASYEGMNKALAAAKQGDFYGRLRFTAYSEGVPLESMTWRTNPALQRKIEDRALTLKGVRGDRTFKDTTREALVEAYIHADEDDAVYILKSLEDAGFVRSTPPGPGATPKEIRAYERYTYIVQVRERANLTAEQMDEMLAAGGIEKAPEAVPEAELPSPIAPAQATITPETLQKTSEEAKLFRRVTARDIRSDGDKMIAKQLQSGDIGEDQARSMAQQFTFPANKDRPEAHMSIMDLVLEKMYLHDDMATVNRAAASDIAIALRRTRSEVVSDVMAAQDLKMPQINKVLRANMNYINAVREGLLLSPFRAGSAGLLDAVGNGLFQAMRGHPTAAVRTLNPLNHLAWMKHTMRGKEVHTSPFRLLEALETSMPNSIVEVQTRDLLDPLDETTWGKLGAYIGGVGGRSKTGAKIGAAATRPIASRTARAFRHGIDQNARSVLFADDIAQALPEARARFLIEMRKSIPGPKVDAIAKDLGYTAEARSRFTFRGDNTPREAFGPSQVRAAFSKHDAPGGAAWAQKWRARIDELKVDAKQEVERVHFTYKMSKADEVARHTIMFHYWLSRAMLYYPKTVLGNPYLLNLNYKMWRELDAEAERQDAGNPMNLFFKYMAGDGGVYALIDPIGMLLPYTMFRDLATSYGDEKGFDKWSRRFGVFVNPAIAAAVTMAGLSEKFPDLSGTLGTRNGILSIIDWARNHGFDLGQGPGITGDPISHIQNGVIDLVNDAASWITKGGIEDVPPPDPEQARTTQAINIMIGQAEDEFDMTYAEMHEPENKEILDEVTAAQIAIMTGTIEDNERAQRAVAQMSEDRIIQTGARASVPGNVQIQNENVGEFRENLDSSFDREAGEPLTPAEESARLQSDASRAGSPEALTLDTENEAYQQLGTEDQQTLNKGWAIVAFDEFNPWSMIEIGGREYLGREINDMTQEQRMKLADAWVLDEMARSSEDGSVDEEDNAFTDYRDEREQFEEGSTELAGYKEYQAEARKYDGGEKRGNKRYRFNEDGTIGIDYDVEGGIRSFRTDLEQVSPEFGQEIADERKRLEAQGLTGEELEQRLDMWTNSPEGYNAWRAVRDKIGDADPLPRFDPTQQEPILPRGTTEESASAGDGTSGYNEERDMPQWQADLVDEVADYQQVVADFEAQYGSIDNFSTRQGQAAIEKFFAERGIEPSRNMREYINWAAEEYAAGRDGSIEAFLAMKDAEYQERKTREAAAA